MSNLETLHTTDDWQYREFGTQPERVSLGFDRRDEALAATTAVLGPLATMLARTDSEPFRPMFEAHPQPTAQEVATTVEFLPAYEIEAPDWRNGAREHIAGAAIMFASERADLADARRQDFELAA
jgi:hypothetical protein